MLPPLAQTDAYFHVADCTNELYAGKLPQDDGRTIQSRLFNANAVQIPGLCQH